MTESENNFFIRPLALSEAHLASSSEREALANEAWSEEGIIDTLKLNGHYLAAFFNNEYVGHIGCTVVLDEGYITNVAVLKNFRRQGVASLLIKALIEKATALKLSFLSLEVRQSNTAAILLYEKHGFKLCGKRPNFYKNPDEDALIMTLNF